MASKAAYPSEGLRGLVIHVCYDHDTGVGAKVQVPELMTGGKRGDEELRRIPSRRSPRNTGSDEPAMAVLPCALISCARE